MKDESGEKSESSALVMEKAGSRRGLTEIASSKSPDRSQLSDYRSKHISIFVKVSSSRCLRQG